MNIPTNAQIGSPGQAPIEKVKSGQRPVFKELLEDIRRKRFNGVLTWAPVIKQMFEKVAHEKWSGRKIYHWLKFDLNFKTITGNKNLTLGNIYMILQNHFYYGVFEYPKNSGNWYTGKHQPIVTREVFDLAREPLKRSDILNINKEFAFTKLMACGLCGSGISADEKFKRQQNGNVHRYVYYGCCKFHDKQCKCGYIREDELVRQLEAMLDSLDLDEIGMKEHIKSEVERYKKFQSGVLGVKEKIKVADIEIRNYAKYVLREGTNFEKRELLSCLKSKLLLNNKVLSFDNSTQKIAKD